MKKLLILIFLMCISVCLASPKFGMDYTDDEIDDLLASINYAFVTSNDAGTNVTGTELETLSDGSDVGALHTHTETDPVYSAWIAGPPNISEFTNDSGYLTPATALWSRAGTVLSPTTAGDSISTTGSGTFQTGITDGTTVIQFGNYTWVGNITGADVDISAGTGSYLSSGTIGCGAITATSVISSLVTSNELVLKPSTEVNTIFRITSGDASSAGFYLTNDYDNPTTSANSAFGMLANTTRGQMVQFVNATVGNAITITNIANRSKLHDHAATTNPTLFIHSITDPDSDNTQWLGLTHNTTTALITSGKGEISFDNENLVTTGTLGAGATTLTGDLAMSTHNISGAGSITATGSLNAPQLVFGTATPGDYILKQIGNDVGFYIAGTDFLWGTKSNVFTIALGGADEYTFSSTEADFKDNNLTTTGEITGTEIHSSRYVGQTAGDAQITLFTNSDESEGFLLSTDATNTKINRFNTDKPISIVNIAKIVSNVVAPADFGTFTIYNNSAQTVGLQVGFTGAVTTGEVTLNAVNAAFLTCLNGFKASSVTVGDLVIGDGTITDTTGLQLAADVDIVGDATISSQLAIGSLGAIAAGRMIHASEEETIVGATYAMNFISTLKPTGTKTGVSVGAYGSIATGNNEDFSGKLVGFQALMAATGTGTVSDVRGFESDISLVGFGGTLTNLYNFYSKTPAFTFTVGTGYGFYHQGHHASVTNKWAFYAAADPSYFGGDVSVNGITKLGDGGTTDYTAFSTTGDIDLYGAANNIENHTGNLTVKSIGDIYLESTSGVIKTGTSIGNVLSYLLGNITGDGANFVYWQIDDTDDRLELIRSGTAVTEYFIDMPVAVNNRISSGTLTFSTVGPTDDIDVSGINTLFIDASGNAVTIGGFAGGVDGQVLRVVRIEGSANNVTVENNEGGATQVIYLHRGSDETLTAEFGGWTFVCHGGVDWHDTSHSRH